MDNLPANSDTINKAIDIVDESTKETRKELDKTAAKGISKLAQLFWASPLGIKADVYIAERPFKLEKALKEMQTKYDNNIPAEYRVEPSSYIALKSVNELNYSLDEDYLKEMFENLLISDMDSRKKGNVLPSFIEIIKNLSSNDAKFLKLLKTEGKGVACSVQMIAINGRGSVVYYDKYIITNYDDKSNCSVKRIDWLTLENLEKEKIIETRYNESLQDRNEEYDYLFNSAKSNFPYKLEEGYRLSCKKGIISLTAMGSKFVDICID